MNNRFMYVGPTISGVAIRNTTYAKKPDALKAEIKAKPYLKELCVPFSALPSAMGQINHRSGGIYTMYQNALADAEEIQRLVREGA